jgi:hypothetical protein
LLGDSFRRNETEGFAVSQEKWSQNILPFGPYKYSPRPTAVSGFMMQWLKTPHFAAAIHFAGAQPANLVGAHASESLQANHCSHGIGQLGQRGFDRRFVNWADRLVFWCLGMTAAQPGYRRECLPRGDWNQLLASRPFEHAANAAERNI